MESLSFIFTPIPAIFVLIPLVIITAVALTAFLKKSNQSEPLVAKAVPASAVPTPVTKPIPEPAPVATPASALVVETPTPVAEVPPTSSWRPSEPVVAEEVVAEVPVVEASPASVPEPVAQPVQGEIAQETAPAPQVEVPVA